MPKLHLCTAVAAILAIITLPAHARDGDDDAAWSVGGEVVAASDYV